LISIYREHYELLELIGIFSLAFLFVLNAVFVAPANRPCKLPLPLICLASISTAVLIILALGAGGFLLIFLGCWTVFISVFLLFVISIDVKLVTSPSPRLYERLLLLMPYGVRVAVPLAYLLLASLFTFGLNRLDEKVVVSFLWFGAAAFGALGLFSWFAYGGMVRNFWTTAKSSHRLIFAGSNSVFIALIGTLVWTKSVYYSANGIPVLIPRLFEAGNIQEDRKAFELDNRCGFIDNKRRVVIPAQFRAVRSFSEGLAAVKPVSDNRWGYIDLSGNLKIPARFVDAGEFKGGLAACALSGIWTEDKVKLTENVATHSIATTGGVAPSGLMVWGVINKNGDMVSESFIQGDLRYFHYSPIYVSPGLAIKLIKDKDKVNSTPSLVVSKNEPSHLCKVSIISRTDNSKELQLFLQQLVMRCQRDWYPDGLEKPQEMKLLVKYDCRSGLFDTKQLTFNSEFERSIEQVLKKKMLTSKQFNNVILDLDMRFTHELFR
jgi:hypothetical protein